MAASSHVEVARRLLANVEAETSDQSPTTMHIPVRNYRDPERWEQEIEMIFHRVPLIVALSCDLREPGDWAALEDEVLKSSSQEDLHVRCPTCYRRATSVPIEASFDIERGTR